MTPIKFASSAPPDIILIQVPFANPSIPTVKLTTKELGLVPHATQVSESLKTLVSQESQVILIVMNLMGIFA